MKYILKGISIALAITAFIFWRAVVSYKTFLYKTILIETQQQKEAETRLYDETIKEAEEKVREAQTRLQILSPENRGK